MRLRTLAGEEMIFDKKFYFSIKPFPIPAVKAPDTQIVDAINENIRRKDTIVAEI